MLYSSSGITTLLHGWEHGDSEALNQLAPKVFKDLHRIAEKRFSSESTNHTLQPTALVSEVYLRLAHSCRIAFKDRSHFFALARRMMNRILIDHGRKKQAEKRGGEVQHLPLDSAVLNHEPATRRDPQVVSLESALRELARVDRLGFRVVKMRFSVGLNYREIAQVTGASPRTVRRKWTTARLFLYRFMQRQESGADLATKRSSLRSEK